MHIFEISSYKFIIFLPQYTTPIYIEMISSEEDAPVTVSRPMLLKQLKNNAHSERYFSAFRNFKFSTLALTWLLANFPLTTYGQNASVIKGRTQKSKCYIYRNSVLLVYRIGYSQLLLQIKNRVPVFCLHNALSYQNLA